MHYLYAWLLAVLCFVPSDVLAAKASRVSVVSNGTKVSAATVNTIVDSECQESYLSCMDSFCFIENIPGGRCQCSDKHADLSQRLQELMDFEDRTKSALSDSLNRIELGHAADSVLNSANQIIEKSSSVNNKVKKVDEKSQFKKQLDAGQRKMFSLFDNDDDFEHDDEDDPDFIFDANDISKKTGDKLYKAAMTMCIRQTPQKCEESKDMLKMIYVQKINSDCAAFENSLQKQHQDNFIKVVDAKNTVREMALQEVQNANKYNLGECAKEFKKCMQAENICGEDWAGCVKLSATENLKNTGSGAKTKQVFVKGTVSKISLSATSIDTLLANKPLCEHITNQCVREKDNVWDVFIKDIAPAIKVAELEAESNLRSNCLLDVSNCYIKACKDSVGTKNATDSYDMCLSHPENYKSFCKVQLEPCLIATGGSYEQPERSSLWRAISARLSAMRVDKCTIEFKECLQADTRCGEDYSKCIGLDNSVIADMCPDDKLTACYRKYGNSRETVRETLARAAQGILLNVDNAMLTVCTKAVEKSMVNVCGDTSSCYGVLEDGIGAGSLKLLYCSNDDSSDCRSSADGINDADLYDKKGFSAKIDGVIQWDILSADENGISGLDNYKSRATNLSSMTKLGVGRVESELTELINTVNKAIEDVESDPNVQDCVSGRQVTVLNSVGGKSVVGNTDNIRLPNITKTYRRIIANSLLSEARENYLKKYDELQKKTVSDAEDLDKRAVDMVKLQAEIELDKHNPEIKE